MSLSSRRGGTIIEMIVVIMILTTGIIGVYSILSSSNRLATTTEKRIQAINLAREGLEITQNIRDTNWIRFSSNYEDCWSVLNYDINCIGGVGFLKMNGTYIPISSGSGWTLSGGLSVTDSGVYLDSSGLPTQGIAKPIKLCSTILQKNCDTKFTRVIKIVPEGTGALNVNSIVEWRDNTSTDKHIVDLELKLKNWKVNGY